MQVTLVQCCPRLVGGEAVESQLYSSGMNVKKRVARMWKMMKEVIVQNITERMKMLKKSGIWYIQMFRYQSYGYATEFRQRSS
jgi:hypothetical protein